MENLRAESISRICIQHEAHDGRLPRREDMILAADSREYGRMPSILNMLKDTDCLESSPSGAKSWSGSRLTSRRCWQTTPFGSSVYFLLLVGSLWILPASAVFVEFQNCLAESVTNSTALQLQFVPLFLSASFNTTDPSHRLNVTVWGNVTGSTVPLPRYILPPASDASYWDNPNRTEAGGKILDNPFPEGWNHYTTLDSKVNVLTYEPWNDLRDFCNSTTNGTCPLGPTFNGNASNPYDFPSFGFSNPSLSTYAFTSFSATLVITYGDEAKTPIGCVSAVLTPDLGVSLSGVVKYIPVVVLVMVGIATAFAAIWSPWGTADTFRWTTNYGRDADLLRLVTPGFGDCLQYIQFVALTGGLTLNYPGFYQPIVSKVSWSTLMFNQSFVSNGTSDSLQDGLYVTHGMYGLDKLRQLVGMGSVDDVWAGMVIWLLVIIAAVLAFIQIGFFVRWAYRHINNTQEEDLRAKNMPFSVGNVIRIVFNYFLLPIVVLSMFQLVVASQSPAYTVGLAVGMLVLIIGFAIWLLYVIASTRPKSFLFDDLPTVLIYGSLYNTYSDNAAPFALVPILLTFVRGIAIGAVQPSGIAQLVLLAICEVITVLTIHAFRPFHSPTSMNIYHTFFALLRFTTVLLMIAFAPSLGVTEGPKGWIGYAILLMHAVVLVLGFLLNALQTIVEVAARLAGAGEDGGTARGGLVKAFGMRQLSRRLPRHLRQSQNSNNTMLDAENERKSYIMDSGRMRSQSAGSTGILLSQSRQSMGMESISIDAYGAIPPHQVGSGQSSHTPTTPGEASTFSFLPSAAAPSGIGRNKGPILGLGTPESTDPYYRPPRFRRPTLENYSPGAKSRGSWASGNWGHKAPSEQAEPTSPPEQVDVGPSISGRATPEPMVPSTLDGPGGSPNDPRRSKVDYTSREVDFYYGVRGPALNDKQPGRRIKTGPADPTGPAASAAGWFKGLFGGKTKEKGKGFEVVRSSRMPPGMMAAHSRNAPEVDSPPEGIPVATGGIRNGPIDSDDEDSRAGPSNAGGLKPTPASGNENDSLVSPMVSGDEESGDEDFNTTRISDVPPTLSGLEIPGGGIELPSRFPSNATSRASSRRYQPDAPGPSEVSRMPSNKPNVPRKSSKRNSLSVDLTDPTSRFRRQHQTQASLDTNSRIPFERGHRQGNSDISSRSGTEDYDISHSRGTASALGRLSADVSGDRPTSVGYVHQHSIRTVNQSDNPQFLGSSAEVVDGGISGSSSMEKVRHE